MAPLAAVGVEACRVPREAFDGDEVSLPGDGPSGADPGGADEAVGDAVEERVAQVQQRPPVHARQLVLERPGVQPAHSPDDLAFVRRRSLVLGSTN